MKVSFTGHRPTKLHLVEPYNQVNHDKLVRFGVHTLNWFNKTHSVEGVISGMALGWDLAIAEAAMSLNIPVIAAVPCRGQSEIWKGDQSKALYQRILDGATEVHYVWDGTYKTNPNCMGQRNIWMVEHSDEVIALWDGSDGGTSHCVKYAQAKKKTVHNVWAQWLKFRGA